MATRSKGQNPHDHPNYRARCEEVLVPFTFSLLARLAGVSVAAVKKAATTRKFNPRDPEDLIRWLVKRRPDLAGDHSPIGAASNE